MTFIKKFAIRRLYGERDVEINFSDDVKIIVAENGYGKTTVLNTLYSLLAGDLSRLRKIDFRSVELVFGDGSEISLDKKDLVINIPENHGILNHLKMHLNSSEITELLFFVMSNPVSFLRRSAKVIDASKKTGIPVNSLIELIRTTVASNQGQLELGSATKNTQIVKDKFPLHLMYLPTYRRVEADFKDIVDIAEEDVSIGRTINFGMRDVRKSFDEITGQILSSSVEWFSKVNGQMLGQLIDGFTITPELRESIGSPHAVGVVLDRIGSNIDSDRKRQIIQLVKSGEIFRDHDPLVYFLSNLLKVYEQQRENDEAIQRFTEVCNRYLGDKEIVYNESRVTIEVVRRKNKSPVDIEMLSSGEKQIVSLFCQLYLSKKNNLAIFFDEPELSLSIEWQKTLLPDILGSGKCRFLFCTTHSPFVFENELVSKTVDLAEYIKEL